MEYVVQTGLCLEGAQTSAQWFVGPATEALWLTAVACGKPRMLGLSGPSTLYKMSLQNSFVYESLFLIGLNTCSQ